MASKKASSTKKKSSTEKTAAAASPEEELQGAAAAEAADESGEASDPGDAAKSEIARLNAELSAVNESHLQPKKKICSKSAKLLPARAPILRTFGGVRSRSRKSIPNLRLRSSSLNSFPFSIISSGRWTRYPANSASSRGCKVLTWSIRWRATCLRSADCSLLTHMNRPFDPNYHEVVMREGEDNDGEVVVLEELQRGYVMHDRVLRPSLVKVGPPPQSTEADAEQDAADTAATESATDSAQA